MATRSRRGFTPCRTKRAVPAWGFLGSSVVSVPAASKVLLGSFILSNPPLGETVLRTHVRLFVKTDQASGVENQVGSYGIIVVTDRAVAAGAASIPGPFTDGGDDGWFVHQPIVGQNDTEFGGIGYDIDSKAMRKVEDGGEIAIMVENSDLLHGFNIIHQVRLLAKLTES